MRWPDTFIRHTGRSQGCDTFFHQIFADLNGQPFPVVAYAARSRPKLVFQAIPSSSPYARIWAKGSEKSGQQSGIDLYVFGNHVAPSYNKDWVRRMGGDYDQLLNLLSIVESWGRKCSCCWPPGISSLSPMPAPSIKSIWAAKSFVGWLQSNLPNGEWRVEGVGDMVQMDTLTVSPGIENHWDSCRPSLCPYSEIAFLDIDGYLITFSPLVYVLARTEKGKWFWKGYLWAPSMACVKITDTATQGKETQGYIQGIFEIRYINRENT